MSYRSILIKTLFLIIGLVSAVYAFKTQQWTYVEDLLTKFIKYENGGLPEFIALI
ncbi:MAG: hypothetical protein ACP6IP_01285 [Candidatus Njordarchaeia archaeon]